MIILPNRCRIHPEEAFLIFLIRMHDYRKLTSFEAEFGLDYSVLSRTFNYVSNLLAITHIQRIQNNLNFFSGRYELYNRKIREKCLAINNGIAIPNTYNTVCGFQDGTRLKVFLF
jgi:hypothetical protein